MSATDSPAIELRALSKKFPLRWKRRVLHAVEGLDLTVRRGEVFGLLGPNGSGKSTTMKMILGLLRPTSGTAAIFGHPAGSMEARRRLGFLPENPYFHKFLSGDETLRFYGRLVGLRGAALEAKIGELIALVGLEASRTRALGSYSKGMLQRIGLAQALLGDPDLILLDEPTAGVDPLGAHDIKVLIRRLRDRGKTVVFSSHLLEEVEAVADRVAILHLGQKAMEGSLDELLSVPDRTEVTAHGLPASAHAAVAAELERHGATDVAIRPQRLTLEAFFVGLIKKEQERKGGQP